MVFFSKKNGIYSSKLALHSYGVALQAVIGMKMVLCSPNATDFSLIFNVRSLDGLSKLGFDLLQYGGVIHILLAITTFFGILFTHFVTSVFKWPMIIVTMIQGSYCSATAMACAYFLQRGYSTVNSMVEYLGKSIDVLGFDFTKESILVDNREDVFVIGLLAIMASSLYSRAGLIEGDESAPEALVVAPSLTLGLAISFALWAPCRDYRILILGIFWFLVCLAGEVISSVSSFKCFKFLNITMIVVYLCMVIFSLITIVHCTKIYTNGRLDYSSYVAIVKGHVGEYIAQKGVDRYLDRYVSTENVRKYLKTLSVEHTDEQINFYMGNGDFLVVIILLSVFNFFFSVVATLYTLFHFFAGGNEAEDDTHGKNVCVVIDRNK